MVLALLVAAGAGGCVPTSGSPKFRANGRARSLPTGPLAAVTGDDFEGILVGLRGRPVIVNVWASWCGPCRVEAPLLQRASERYGNDVAVIGVDSRDTRDAGLEFLERYDIRYPNVFDKTGEIRRRLALRGFPTTYIFDRTGSLRSTVVGGVSEQVLAAHVADAGR